MNFFKFESVGFIISLGITLLLCGLIMFYMRQRFAAYDRHLVEQSQLLKHLVSTIQSNTSGAVNTSRQEIAAPSAVKAAEKIFSKSETKIVVSDDEVESETDEESDSESDSSDSETSKESEENSKCCDSLGKCPINSFPFGNMLSLLANNNQTKIKTDNDIDGDDTESDGDEDDDSDEDSKSSKSTRDSLNDFVNKTEEIKHIEFSPHLDGIKMVGEDDLMDKLNIQSLDISGVDYSKVNLDEIQVKKLDDIIQDDDNNKEIETMSNLKDLSKKALQDLCKERNLPLNGTRGELIKRLTQ